MQNRIAMVVGLGLVVGCTRETVVVPPQAVPALAESQAVTYERTSDGKRVVEQGPIRWVSVRTWPAATSKKDSPEEATYGDVFRAPFQAKLSGDQLQVSDDDHQSRHALRDIREVEVRYEARVGSPGTAMRMAGITLTSLGSAAFVGGVTLIGVLESSLHGGPVALLFWGLPILAPSAVFTGIGIPLWVEGARRLGPGLPTTVPTLVPARNGAALRWTF
jgi:hypothetical protein